MPSEPRNCSCSAGPRRSNSMCQRRMARSSMPASRSNSTQAALSNSGGRGLLETFDAIPPTIVVAGATKQFAGRFPKADGQELCCADPKFRPASSECQKNPIQPDEVHKSVAAASLHVIRNADSRLPCERQRATNRCGRNTTACSGSNQIGEPVGIWIWISAWSNGRDSGKPPSRWLGSPAVLTDLSNFACFYLQPFQEALLCFRMKGFKQLMPAFHRRFVQAQGFEHSDPFFFVQVLFHGFDSSAGFCSSGRSLCTMKR